MRPSAPPRPPILPRPALLFLFVFLLALRVAVAQPPVCENPVTRCDDADNQFPEDERIQIKYANRTIRDLKYANKFVDFTVRGAADDDIFEYRFVRCGCDPGDDSSGREVIFINPASMYVSETPSLALYQRLAPSRLSIITHVPTRRFIFNSEVRARIKRGLITEIQDENFQSNFDLIKSVSVSVIGSFPFGVEQYVNASTGVPFLVVAEANEVSPLARAEWMKIIGLLINQPKKANDLFKDIEDRYNGAKDKAAQVVRRPSVFFNYPSVTGTADVQTIDEKYTWTQPVKGDYILQFIIDANADYRYKDTQDDDDSSSGISYNISTIVRDFRSARYLVQSESYPGANDRTLEEYLGLLISSFDGSSKPDPDVRKEFEKLDAVRCVNVWSEQKRITQDGNSIDFYESGIFRPDDILNDFVKLLHPYLEFDNPETVFLYQYRETDAVRGKCPYTVLSGDPPNGMKYFDQKFDIPNRNRFQVEDLMASKVIPEIKKQVNDTEFEVFFHHEDRDADNTVATVRSKLEEKQEQAFNDSRAVFRGMRAALGANVTERNAAGQTREDPLDDDQKPDAADSDDDGGGLSGGAIAGIVIAVLAVVAIVGVLVWRRSRNRAPRQAVLSNDQYWADPDVGTGRAGGAAGVGPEARPFAQSAI